MILVFALVFALLLSPTILGQGDTLVFTHPLTIHQCEQVPFSWIGGTPPYSLAAMRVTFDAATANPTLVYPTETSNTGNAGGPGGGFDPRFVLWKTTQTSVSWTVTAAAGWAVAVAVLDANAVSLLHTSADLQNMVLNAIATGVQPPGARVKLWTVAPGTSYSCLIDDSKTSTMYPPVSTDVSTSWATPLTSSSSSSSSSSSASRTSPSIGPTSSSAKSNNAALIGGVVGGVGGVVVIAGLIGALFICRRRRRNSRRNSQPNPYDGVFVIDTDVPSPSPYPRAPAVHTPLLEPSQAGYGDHLVSAAPAAAGPSNAANASQRWGAGTHSPTGSRTDSSSSASSSSPLMRQTKGLGAGIRNTSSRSGLSRSDSEMAPDMPSPGTIIEFAEDGGSMPPQAPPKHVVMPPLYNPSWGERQ